MQALIESNAAMRTGHRRMGDNLKWFHYLVNCDLTEIFCLKASVVPSGIGAGSICKFAAKMFRLIRQALAENSEAWMFVNHAAFSFD